MKRRAFLTGAFAGAASPAVAHTLYGQWIAYRKKHLLVGCHRKDEETFRLANLMVETINLAYPAAKARAARTPHPDRLASLLGTDQMEVAILPGREAVQIAQGQGRFRVYGRIPLTRIANFGTYLFVAHAGFPNRHAWILRDAVVDSGLELGQTTALPWHPGVLAHMKGVPFAQLVGPAATGDPVRD